MTTPERDDGEEPIVPGPVFECELSDALSTYDLEMRARIERLIAEIAYWKRRALKAEGA